MTPPINSDAEAYMAMHDAATAAYEAATPPDYRYSAIALRKAVDAAVELSARRAANTPVDGVSIKPLEWGDHDSLSIIAHTVRGPYLVEVINSPRVALWLPNMTGQARKMIEGFDSVEDAKAAAQADFNARIQSCLTSPAAEPVAWMTEATDGLPPEKRGTTADPQTAEYWRSTSNVIPLYTHPAPSASREVTDGLRLAFRNADESDWKHLFAVLPDTGRGRFWKSVLSEARAALLAALPEREG